MKGLPLLLCEVGWVEAVGAGVPVTKGRATPTLCVLLSAFLQVHEVTVSRGGRCGEGGDVRGRPSQDLINPRPCPNILPTVDLDKQGDEEVTGDVRVIICRSLFAERRRELGG